MPDLVMEGVTEYSEYGEVKLIEAPYPKEKKGRLCIEASTDGGYLSTYVDLIELLAWLKTNRPELLPK
jgi:hypothetical protein